MQFQKLIFLDRVVIEVYDHLAIDSHQRGLFENFLKISQSVSGQNSALFQSQKKVYCYLTGNFGIQKGIFF